MTQVADRYETLTTGFEAFRRQPSFGGGALGRAREAAFERFAALGFPTTRDEEWRFTNVAPIAAVAFEPAGDASVSAAEIAPLLYPDIPHHLVLVNGRLAPSLSSMALPDGVTVRWDTTDEWRAPSATHPGHVFVDLNTAFFERTLVIEVASKAVVTQPVQVLHVAVGGSLAALASPRLEVVVGEAAQLTLIESYAGRGSGPTFTNAVTVIRVGQSAFLDHVKVQDEPSSAFHLASTFVEVARAGTFTSQAITVGGRIARNDIVSVLAGEGAECTLNGLYVADGDTVVDTHTTIDHAEPHCPSHEVYKGILSGRARAVFNGKIIVRQDAQKTDAKQTNKALLLTDDAQINTKPQLEIFADDVKCTHGAAIGQLDEDALFYLRARGIPAHEARNMLIHAFAGDVLNGIRIDAVRDRAMERIDDKLALKNG